MGSTDKLDHTEKFLVASETRLRDAKSESVSAGGRISSAFLSAYNALQAIQPPYSGSLNDHPLTSIVTNGAARVGLSETDLNLGLQLLVWEDYARYHFEPPPTSVLGAIAWAERVRDAVSKFSAGKRTPNLRAYRTSACESAETCVGV